MSPQFKVLTGTVLFASLLIILFPKPPALSDTPVQHTYNNEIVLEPIINYTLPEAIIVDARPMTKLTARVTAYAPYDNVSGICNDGDPSTTSTGSTPGWGTIAVNPKLIPYGTKLYIPGYGIGVASDTGGALRKYKGVAIDLYMDTHQQAMQWGSQIITIYILD